MKNEAGFTLIEVMVTFAIFLIIASVIPQYFKLISFDARYNQRLETSIFFQQLANDVHEAAQINVLNNILYLEKMNNQTVTYAFSQQRIRRQVNNQGQEIVLLNVQQIQFSKWVNGIDIVVYDRFNQSYEKRITHLLPLEKIKDG